MAFRDDREASQQRVDALERELATAKTELDAARLRASENEDLKKRLAALGEENATLRRGVEPKSAARLRAATLTFVAVLAALVIAGGVAWSLASTELQRAQVGEQLAVSAVQQCEAEVGPVRGELERARTELSGIDEAHRAEMARLETLLSHAQLHEVGAALLVTAHVTEREGNVPTGTADDCVLAIRDNGDAGACVATVLCGTTRVYPFNEPAPTVRCAGAAGAWRADGTAPLLTATASADSRLPLLLDYDGRARTLVVRETGAPVFTLHLRVTDALPFRLPSRDP